MPGKGITRKRITTGKGRIAVLWEYFDTKGKRITDTKVINRCNKLVLPPAWVDVWISTNPKADLQATGKDAKGRLQYRYHTNWTATRSAAKFDGMSKFAQLLPTVRKRVASDLGLPGMPKNKVCALIVKLIDVYHFRVGNDEYARKNKSYGLTTMKRGHMTLDRSRSAEGKVDAIFEFMGKSGKMWKRRIWEDDLALMIEESGAVGRDKSRNRDLFRYEDSNGNDFDIKAHHINEYLDAATPHGEKVTAKDFRTWAATWKTASRLARQHDPHTDSARKKVANQIVKTVAADLGNTPTVCRSSYIHPTILAGWSDGTFRTRWNNASKARKMNWLSKEESVTLAYLAGK